MSDDYHLKNLRLNLQHVIDLMNEKQSELRNLIHLKFNFVREEIDIRIDSLKQELESCGDTLKNEVDQLEEYYLRCHAKDFQLFDTSKQEETLKRIGSMDASLIHQETHKFSGDLDALNVDNKTKFLDDLNISLVYEDFNTKWLGEISFNTRMRDQLKLNRFKEIELSIEVLSICNLSNETIAICGIDRLQDRNISIYNKQFKIIKTLYKINNEPIMAQMMRASIDTKRFFICEPKNKRLILTDLDMNFIKYSTSDILSSCCGNFSLTKDYLYVCNFARNRICRFDKELDSHVSFEIERRPFSIEIVQDVACVGEEKHGRPSIAFYEIQSFKCLKRYEGLLGGITTLNMEFFFLNSSGDTIYMFDKHGEFNEEIKLGVFTNRERKGGQLSFFNGFFVISSLKSNCLSII